MRIPKDLRWEPTGQTLGEGGQAQVHLVKDTSGQLDGLWALKALKRAQPGQAYERFRREIAVMQEVRHPNIIRVVDHSADESDFQFYVMEYIEGARTLEKVVASQASPFFGNPVQALDLFRQICSALLGCEENRPKVVHRDLSPSNVLVGPGLNIKLIDFGVCQIEGSESITLVDEGVGTVNYMAPECESGSNEMIRVGADLYSAGKILWTAITGRRAFSRESPVFNEKSMTEMFPNEPMTWHLHHVFEKTIRRDWRNRWGTAKDALTAVALVHNLIRCGYPPIEQIVPRCPICGVGKLLEFNGGHVVFGNPNPQGIFSLQCSYCGFCFPVNLLKPREILENRKKLE
jgi:serine/threonine protein kinase